MTDMTDLRITYFPQTCGGQSWEDIDQDRAIRAFELRLKASGYSPRDILAAWASVGSMGGGNITDQDETDPHTLDLICAYEHAEVAAYGGWHFADGDPIGGSRDLMHAHIAAIDGDDDLTHEEWLYANGGYYVPSTASLCPSWIARE